MKIIAGITILAALPVTDSFADSSLNCASTGSGKSFTLTVSVQSPHAGEMAILTPDGRMIWLQADHIPFQFPVTDAFEQLSEFILDARSRGSWFNEWGEPESVPVFSVNGEYELRIAENLEPRR